MEFKNITALPEHFKKIIDNLKEGNKRFIDNVRLNQDFREQRKNLLKGQRPDVSILTCSDSRVIPHYIFDEKIGELFIIRKAGNVVGTTALGSIEYATAVLNSSVFLVLGHQFCGAVTEALDGKSNSHFINRIISSIEPAINFVKKSGKEPDLDTVIEENVRFQMKRALEQSENLRKFVIDGKLAVIGGIYSLESGRVDFLDEAIY